MIELKASVGSPIVLRQQTRKMFYFCLDESSPVHIFQNQIGTLPVDGNIIKENLTSVYDIGHLFSHILNVFTNVFRLEFYQSTHINICATFTNTTPKFCSTLVELYINVHGFNDCLYLFDGRLNQMRRFFVSIHRIVPLIPVNNNRVSYERKKKSIFKGK